MKHALNIEEKTQLNMWIQRLYTKKKLIVFVKYCQIKFCERIQIGSDEYLLDINNCDEFDEVTES